MKSWLLQLMQNTSHQIHAGVAQIDNTPVMPIYMTGYIAREGPATGVHDPLVATALVLSVGDQRCLLLTCELISLEDDFVAALRADLQARTTIPVENILVTCTLTHSGPATIFLQDCGDVDPSYLASYIPY